MNKGLTEVIVCERRGLRYLAALRVASCVRADGTVDELDLTTQLREQTDEWCGYGKVPLRVRRLGAGAFRTSQVALERVGIKVSA
jgi:hypothetical protein